ncbi:TauD/TfdA family dioxygenase [Tsuneonella mangrovi]|uniref:TauD/TfdA family dioxygenase n=1 Tax=Tsuneonella mangrovi TaxID=1982042 RepID=UPI00196B688F|nr:TauD/TfdA family dioxygenase [Tsuneonella mangrovi]
MTATLANVKAFEPHTIPGSRRDLEDVDVAHVRSALEEHGAILLRDFATSIDGFVDLGRRLCPVSVLNESPNRAMMGERGQAQTVNLGNDPFPLHPELAREPWRPDVALFACFDPPSVGGQTNLCDGIAIAQGLPDELRARLQDALLLYINDASPEALEFWLGTSTPDDQLLANPPARCPYWFRRVQTRILRGFTRPALEPTLFQGEPAWCNFALFARDYLGSRNFPLLNGQPIDDDMLDTVRSVARANTYAHAWQEGDVLVVDNTRFMHGRRAIADASGRQIATFFGYLEGIANRPGEPESPIWRKEMFVPPDKPEGN